jgi:hypothetical protein
MAIFAHAFVGKILLGILPIFLLFISLGMLLHNRFQKRGMTG